MIRRPPRSTLTDTRFPSTTLCLSSLPFLRIVLICWVRVWLLLISAWARSGRVCAVIARLLASARAFCMSPCWVRSEEHTSELQSLMRISYAVFCLKKKHQYNTHHTQATHTHEMQQTI